MSKRQGSSILLIFLNVSGKKILTSVVYEVCQNLGFLEELILCVQDGAVSVSAGVASPGIDGAGIAVVEGEGAIGEVVLRPVPELNCLVLQSSTPVQVQVHDSSSWFMVPAKFMGKVGSCEFRFCLLPYM